MRTAGIVHSERLRTTAAALQARVLHVDDELLVIDKPAGLAVQGGPGASLLPEFASQNQTDQLCLELTK